LDEDKPLVLRILPAMKTLARDEVYCAFDTKLFVTGKSPVDPEKSKCWCIGSIEESEWVGREKVVKVHDPIIDVIRPVMARRDSIQKRGEERGISKDDISKATANERAFLRNHSISGKWSFYAVDRNGDFGVLELSNTTKKDLMEMAKKYAADHDGKNPFGNDFGVWWIFSRSGKSFPIKDKIDILRNQKTVKVDGADVQVEVIETHVFTEEMERMALKILPDFDVERERINYPREVHEQIAAAAGDTLKIRDVMVAADKVKAENAKARALASGAGPVDSEESSQVDPSAVLGDEDPFAGIVPAAAAKPPAATEKAAETKADPVAPTPDEPDEEAELLAKLAAAKKKKEAAAAAAAAAPKTVTAPAAPSDPSKMADDEFDRLFPKAAKKV